MGRPLGQARIVDRMTASLDAAESRNQRRRDLVPDHQAYEWERPAGSAARWARTARRRSTTGHAPAAHSRSTTRAGSSSGPVPRRAAKSEWRCFDTRLAFASPRPTRAARVIRFTRVATFGAAVVPRHRRIACALRRSRARGRAPSSGDHHRRARRTRRRRSSCALFDR